MAVAQYLPVWLLLLSAPPVCAQQLSLRHYDVSDGLAHSQVVAIRQDRKGYLWFGTWEGLSRFDGYRFTNYGVRDGLGHPIINDITEDQRGRLWVATNGGGVSRLIDDPREKVSASQTKPTPEGRRRFISFRVGDSLESNRVNALLFDPTDNLWVATDDGLYRAATGVGNDLQFKLVAPRPPSAYGAVAFADRHGRLWFGMKDELIQVVQDQIIKYGQEDEVRRQGVVSFVEDRRGRLLAATLRGVFEFVAPPDGTVDGKSRGRWQQLPLTLKPDQSIRTMLSVSTGALWLGTSNGLVKYLDGKQSLYTDAQGLSNSDILALTEDSDGNLWIGLAGNGVCKLSGELIVSFTKIEGLPGQAVNGIIEDRQGHLYAGIVNGGLVELVEGRVVPVSGAPRASNSFLAPFQDSRGNWWIQTPAGLFWSEGSRLQYQRGRKLTAADGIPPDKFKTPSLMAEDPFGKLWIMSERKTLYQLDLLKEGRGRQAVFERVPLNPTLPGPVISMFSDRAGTLWFSGHTMLARLKQGKVSVFSPTEGLPETEPRAFFQDSRGWLWIGLRYKGVSVTKDPAAEAPQFVNYSTQTGLASDTVWAITEDDAGRIYLGTGKGLDQLDPTTGRIRHFNVRDGLAGAVVSQCIKDQAGNIWAATPRGLSKFDPRAERIVNRPPPIFFSRVQVAGEDLALPETGAERVPQLELTATRNNLLVEYVALSFQGEQRLRYQYKLEGVDEDWSQPTEARSVNYARLAPGSYQLQVRAINQEGVLSAEPALFQFRILPPLWQRWWFLALAALLAGATIYALHRYRVAQLLALERVRTRIATDLHDDIGASLSRVAILSEVVKRQVGDSPTPGTQSIPLLTEIADSARGLAASMREIIWAIDPRQDELGNVVAEVREFASGVLETQGINWDFQVAPELETIKLDPEQRRHLFLIFKEAINNIARHADCRSVSLSLTIARQQLWGEIRDDGCGFTTNGGGPASVANGHGLENMRRRAAQVGGQVVIDSAPGCGVSIKLMIPLKRR
jgi:ligand-binding sensor domain-containing protein/signal transduction histidine kinase